MPFKLLCLVLLISCASQTVHSGGIRDRLTYDDELQGKIKQEKDTTVTFNSVTLSYSDGLGGRATTTNLKFCSTKVLYTGGLDSTSVVLTYEAAGKQEDISGTIPDPDMKCAVFTDETGFISLPSVLTTYTISFIVDGVTSQGSVAFAMTVSANTVTCDGKNVIRAEWTAGADVPTIQNCPVTSEKKICYVDGDLSEPGFCFSSTGNLPATLNICIEGKNLISSTTETTPLQIVHLEYVGTPITTGSLSLTIEDADSPFEAIVKYEDGTVDTYIFETTDGTGLCEIASFAPSVEAYTVCSVRLKESEFHTSVSSITDMDVNAYIDTTNNLLQFRFANENPKENYVAFLYDSATIQDTSVNLDCTALEEGSTCYGFIHIESGTSATHLVVGWAPEDVGDDITNKIAYPYPAISSSNMFHTL